MKNYLKEKRRVFDLSQEQLADKVQVSRQTIISIEKGVYNPSLKLAFMLAKLFQCRIEDLFIFEEEEE
ncbi:helix-turn-helix transcriptional regulator [Baia soyae]|uniref:Putative transcriptional regulator n=1 Tax=Baia soyae TaxID=1544746 RepID=A0A4R2S487_9BACL|nr:helix-turn-helix transcriptional regulator [Baia soyae]TCP70582.1 putative transcriptional regulator [Baia soyae]